MIPVNTFEIILDQANYSSTKQIFSFLLYTSDDSDLIEYVGERIHSLDALTGDYCGVFYIGTRRKPSPLSSKMLGEIRFENRGGNKPRAPSLERIRSLEVDGLRRLVDLPTSKMGTGSLLHALRPLNDEEAYRVADRLRFNRKLIPCFVFFRDLQTKEWLVYPIDTAWTERELTKNLRELFGPMNMIGQSAISSGKTVSEEIWKDLKKRLRNDGSHRNLEAVLVAAGIFVGAVLRGLTSEI